MAAQPGISAAAQVNAKCCNTTAKPGRLEAGFPLVRVPATVFALENHLPMGEMLHDSDPTVALSAVAGAVVAVNHLMQSKLAEIEQKLAALHAEVMEGINDESYTEDEDEPPKKKFKPGKMELDDDSDDE